MRKTRYFFKIILISAVMVAFCHGIGMAQTLVGTPEWNTAQPTPTPITGSGGGSYYLGGETYSFNIIVSTGSALPSIIDWSKLTVTVKAGLESGTVSLLPVQVSGNDFIVSGTFAAPAVAGADGQVINITMVLNDTTNSVFFTGSKNTSATVKTSIVISTFSVAWNVEPAPTSITGSNAGSYYLSGNVYNYAIRVTGTKPTGTSWDPAIDWTGVSVTAPTGILVGAPLNVTEVTAGDSYVVNISGVIDIQSGAIDGDNIVMTVGLSNATANFSGLSTNATTATVKTSIALDNDDVNAISWEGGEPTGTSLSLVSDVGPYYLAASGFTYSFAIRVTVNKPHTSWAPAIDWSNGLTVSAETSTVSVPVTLASPSPVANSPDTYSVVISGTFTVPTGITNNEVISFRVQLSSVNATTTASFDQSINTSTTVRKSIQLTNADLINVDWTTVEPAGDNISGTDYYLGGLTYAFSISVTAQEPVPGLWAPAIDWTGADFEVKAKTVGTPVTVPVSSVLVTPISGDTYNVTITGSFTVPDTAPDIATNGDFVSITVVLNNDTAALSKPVPTTSIAVKTSIQITSFTATWTSTPPTSSTLSNGSYYVFGRTYNFSIKGTSTKPSLTPSWAPAIDWTTDFVVTAQTSGGVTVPVSSVSVTPISGDTYNVTITGSFTVPATAVDNNTIDITVALGNTSSNPTASFSDSVSTTAGVKTSIRMHNFVVTKGTRTTDANYYNSSGSFGQNTIKFRCTYDTGAAYYAADLVRNFVTISNVRLKVGTSPTYYSSEPATPPVIDGSGLITFKLPLDAVSFFSSYGTGGSYDISARITAGGTSKTSSNSETFNIATVAGIMIQPRLDPTTTQLTQAINFTSPAPVLDHTYTGATVANNTHYRDLTVSNTLQVQITRSWFPDNNQSVDVTLGFFPDDALNGSGIVTGSPDTKTITLSFGSGVNSHTVNITSANAPFINPNDAKRFHIFVINVTSPTLTALNSSWQSGVAATPQAKKTAVWLDNENGPTPISPLPELNVFAFTTKLHVSWTPAATLLPQLNNKDYDIYSYRLRYKKSSDPDVAASWQKIDVTDSADMGGSMANILAKYEHNIEGLDSLTAYDIVLLGVDIFGNEGRLGEKSFMTSPLSVVIRLTDGRNTYENSAFGNHKLDNPVQVYRTNITVTALITSGGVTTPIRGAALVAADGTSIGGTSFDILTTTPRYEFAGTQKPDGSWQFIIPTTSNLMTMGNKVGFILRLNDGIADTFVDYDPDIGSPPHSDHIWAFWLDPDNQVVLEPWPTRILNNVITDKNPVAYPSYYLSDDAKVTIKVYDIKGRAVATILDGESRKGGQNIKENGWRGSNRSGKKLGVGLYYMHFQARRESDGKVILDKFMKVVIAR